MCKSLLSLIFIALMLIGLSSCGQNPENSEVKQQLKTVVEKEAVDQKNQSEIIDHSEHGSKPVILNGEPG